MKCDVWLQLESETPTYFELGVVKVEVPLISYTQNLLSDSKRTLALSDEVDTPPPPPPPPMPLMVIVDSVSGPGSAQVIYRLLLL